MLFYDKYHVKCFTILILYNNHQLLDYKFLNSKLLINNKLLEYKSPNFKLLINNKLLDNKLLNFKLLINNNIVLGPGDSEVLELNLS